jgi:hypothetical protein
LSVPLLNQSIWPGPANAAVPIKVKSWLSATDLPMQQFHRARARGSLCQPQMSVYVLPGNVRKLILKPKALPYAPGAPPLSPY